MNPRDVVKIQSSNVDLNIPYLPNDACTWRFIGRECTISAECPCFDVSPSFNCIEDYLKILDLPYYHQKFCGITKPNGPYRASTDVFSIRFRSNGGVSAKGFVCFVQCTAPGESEFSIADAALLACSNF
ncbi:bone morphogenetic protein 1-like [Folsomia candida]|uniref:Cubilin n=1 Tax=Folsomia candida TaxID=158441 RepID=A0A226E754_FOLCA|nr:bone morphogenetic protein 1-like [Folsomia candida]XP_035708147.1 bone morphogenetic protein 1-like [Folsomia candida]OXA53422.1 Cubilin [Folsomia candida]